MFGIEFKEKKKNLFTTVIVDNKLFKEDKAKPILAEGLSDDCFYFIRDYIYKNSGIYFEEKKRNLLERKVRKRIELLELISYDDYIRYLLSTQSSTETEELLESVTINESYFFRNIQQINALERIVVPELLEFKKSTGNKVIRIWSAACSTGEEPYSVAMMLNNKFFKNYPDFKFQIVASDLNSNSLEYAKKGIYTETSLRNTPNEYLEKYFAIQNRNYHIADDIKKTVKFLRVNLFDSTQVSSFVGVDIIFCCNVLIYFDLNSRQKVVNDLYNSLNNKGILFLGTSESLYGLQSQFKLIHLPETLAYRKIIF